MKMLYKLKQWRDLLDANYMEELPEIRAGHMAEEFLKEIIESNLKYKGAFCFIGKRVPSAIHKRRFEIDLIVLTKKHLHFLEVKNWSGELIENDDNWIQINRNGESITNPNLTQYNSNKCDAVIEYLDGKGVNLDKKYFTQKVIFMNPRLKIARSIEKNPDVIPADKLNQYLKTQKGSSSAENLAHSMIELCLDSEKSNIILDGLFHAMSNENYKLAQKNLSELETWDKILLHGGRILTGDALKVVTKSETISMKEIASGTKCKVKWNRQKFMSLIQSLITNFPLGKLYLPDSKIILEPNDTIKFHIVGDEKPSNIKMRDIDLIVRG